MPTGSHYQRLVLRYIALAASASNACAYYISYRIPQNAKTPSVRSPFKHFSKHFSACTASTATRPVHDSAAFHFVNTFHFANTQTLRTLRTIKNFVLPSDNILSHIPISFCQYAALKKILFHLPSDNVQPIKRSTHSRSLIRWLLLPGIFWPTDNVSQIPRQVAGTPCSLMQLRKYILFIRAYISPHITLSGKRNLWE